MEGADRQRGSGAWRWLLGCTGGLLLLLLGRAGAEQGTGRLRPCRILAIGVSPSEFRAADEIRVGVAYRCEAEVGEAAVMVTYQPGENGDGGATTVEKSTAVLRRGQSIFYAPSVRAGKGGCYTVTASRGGEMSATVCPQPVRWAAQTVRFQ